MHDNFENLQKRCKKYKLKKRVKLSLQIALIPALASIFLLINTKSTELEKTSSTQNSVLNEKEQKTSIKKEKKKRIIKDVPYVVLIDSKYNFNKTKEVKKSPQTAVQKKTIVQTEIPKDTPKVYIKKETNRAVEIAVKKLDSINDMITYYNKENKYSLAIKIAQTYYDSKQYSKSLLWAKKANLLNRDDDKAWILYAKSEYAQNNHKRAIKILKLYLTNSISKEAEGLLLMWNQGK